ncbi:unnamed protein product [Lactuca virosa]|uniref:BAH domain-containing protein n=1 Tax=Lactuca virosa TaxID=75947 RepID=A0AAU9MTZ2_9ASTR|nr:unnamed protein product [Lactuca virosa]
MCASEQTFSGMRRACDFSGEKKPKSSLVIAGAANSKKNKEPESSGLQIQEEEEEEEEEDDENFEIIWSGESSMCTRNLKHYQAFTKNGTTISVYSFVFILAGEGGYHIGYLEDMYENYRQKKMVKVRWFHRSEELSELISNPQPHELIITSHCQILSAECIDGLATILTPKHYNQCLAFVTQDFSDGIYMCSKQIKNDKISSFPFSKLRGYYTQIIFSVLNLPIGPNKNNQETSSKREEEQEQEQEQEEEEEKGKEKGKGKEKEEGVQSFKRGVTIVDNEVEKTQPFRVGEEIEVLSNDSGIRGCWFRCKILKISEKGLKVLYMDVEDAVGLGNLEEWVLAYKIAAADKMGMRWLGRNSIRPACPIMESSDDGFKIGSAVDAWWCDGWWEGVVIGINIRGKNDFQVYFPGENRLHYFEKTNLRASKEWVDNKWIEIKPKPDVVSFLTSNMKLQKKSSLGGPSGSGSGSSSKTGANNVVMMKKKKKKALMGFSKPKDSKMGGKY